MFLISLNYLSFVYLVSDTINALTWVIIFYVKYLKIQTQDYHCWVTALAKSLSCYPTNEAFNKSLYFLLDCLKQNIANMLSVSLIFLGFRWYPRTTQHCLIYQSGSMEP